MTRFFLASFIALFLALGPVPTASVLSQSDKKQEPDDTPARIGEGQKRWYAQYKKQPNAPDPTKQLLNTDAEPDLKTGFDNLFNGKDLTGWTPLGGTCDFSVENGEIVGTCIKGSQSTYLSTNEKSFDNFIFTCDIKWEVEGNTGIMFRAKTKPNEKAKQDNAKTTIVFGPQLEVEEPSKGRFWSGGIYGQSCGGYFYPLWLQEHVPTRTAIKKDDWNRVTISATGKVVKTWINGVPMSHWIDAKDEYPKGYFGLQIHKGRQGKVRFRNIKVKRLD